MAVFAVTVCSVFTTYQSELMQFIVMAMRTIGEGITDEQMQILDKHLQQVNDEEYKMDINLAPIWVRNRLNTWKRR